MTEITITFFTKTIRVTSLIFALISAPPLFAKTSDVVIHPEVLADHQTIYIGENIGELQVYEDGQVRGTESFEVRYGTSPSMENTVAKADLTETFILAHNQQTEFVIAYLHGITDSAFQGKDIARWAFTHGYNFVSKRLRGHGDDSDHIGEVQLSEWQADTDAAIEQAKLLGRNVVLMGFSTGGALAVERAFRNPGDIARLVGEAPAIGIGVKIFAWLEKFHLVEPLSYILPYVGKTKTEQLEVRQARKSTHGLHVVDQLGKEIQDQVNAGKRLNIPTLFITSSADTAIDESWIPKTMAAIDHAERLDFKKSEQFPDPPIHSALVYDRKYVAHNVYPSSKNPTPLPFAALNEVNPYFDVMMDKIEATIQYCPGTILN